MRRFPLRSALAGALTLALLLGCKSRSAFAAPRPAGTRAAPAEQIVEPIFAGGYQGDWAYYGWADPEPGGGAGPLRLRMEKKAGWILNNSKLKGAFGGVTFRFKAPADFGEFLQVKLESELLKLPVVRLEPRHRRELPGGWSEVFVSMAELNPGLVAFKQVVIRAIEAVPPPGVVEFDQVGLTAADPKQVAAVAAQPGTPAAFTVDCRANTTPISPLIYGIALSVKNEARDDAHWKLNATARRWGGNAMTRYNWKLGNARNTAADWFYENLSMGDYTWKSFLEVNQAHRVQSVLTLPMIGWVAKDTRSVGFPLSEVPAQQETDPDKGAGNGVGLDKKPIPSGPPTRTSVAAPAAFIAEWVKAIAAFDAERGAQRPPIYILDNEPALWSDTHRDVHPAPLSYDELLARTLEYGAAVRAAAPNALIAGPAEWGWTNYEYSAADVAAGVRSAPDRKAHGDVPLIEWYLRKLAEHEKKTGQRLLDVVDVHFYPQAKGVGLGEGGETDPQSNALRIRSTRALWDPTYVDESWIKEAVQLIPRMRGWVARNYPGRKLAIGEYNFGAEKHPSGGLALAEALGRFGQQGLDAAFYWTYPEEGTPAFWAFRAYRDFDGQGATFEELALPTRAPADASLFAARSADKKRLTLVLLNFSPVTTLEASVALEGCAAAPSQRVFSYPAFAAGLAAQSAPAGTGYRLPPYSITVVELRWPGADAGR